MNEYAQFVVDDQPAYMVYIKQRPEWMFAVRATDQFPQFNHPPK